VVTITPQYMVEVKIVKNLLNIFDLSWWRDWLWVEQLGFDFQQGLNFYLHHHVHNGSGAPI
jgi:hypothetical protein